MTLAEKVTVALEGVTLTRRQKDLLKVRLSKLLERKRPEEITVPEIQGLTEIVQSALPAGIELLLKEQKP